MPSSLFEEFRGRLLSQTLSTVWRGYGSALFLEFGRLTECFKRDGSPTHPNGEFSIMIEWSWRIEDEKSILCGSWSEEEAWSDIFFSLVGRKLEDISLFGRLPELSVALSGGRYVASFMTSDDQPAWAIFMRSEDGAKPRVLAVEGGEICETA